MTGCCHVGVWLPCKGLKVHLGILPPPGEHISDPEWLSLVADAAEAAGCESIWLGEHPFSAEQYEPRYPYSPDGRLPFARIVLPDPLEVLSFLAARTNRIRLGTSALILPLHPLPIIAKRAATLDRVSRGRFMLGVGIGWMKEEYSACNVPYEERGRRLDEMLTAMGALWSQSPATHRGRFHSFERVYSDPQPLGSAVPVVVCGSSDAAARRAGRYGNGFFPMSISPDDLADKLGVMRQAALEVGRNPKDIEITVWPGSYDPSRAFDLDFVSAYVALGVSRLVIGAYEWGEPTPKGIGKSLRQYQHDVIGRVSKC